MTILQSILLGIIQGITEFLPISSSAHLVLIPHLLGWDLDPAFIFPFDVLVQLGTLAAVMVFYRQDIGSIFHSAIRGLRSGKPFAEEPARLGWLTLLATVPAGLAGLLIKDQVEAVFNSPSVTAIFLFLTAALLVTAEFFGKKKRTNSDMNWLDALWIGIFQAFSIFPGISRSASAMTGGMTRHLDRPSAGRFAFLMAIPVMLAAGLLGVVDLLQLSNVSAYLPVTLIGVIISAIVGYFSIRWLISYISSHSLLPFAGYCLILAAGSMLLTGFTPISQPFQPTQAPMPVVSELDAYRVAVQPDLEWLLPALNACRQDQPGIQISFQRKATPASFSLEEDMFLVYGELQNSASQIYQIGSDTLQIVVASSSPLEKLSPENLARVFSGREISWLNLHQSCAECFSGQPDTQEIGLYIYPQSSALRQVLEAFFPAGFTFSGYATLAPGAAEMRAAVAGNPAAIGILPQNWMDDSVRTIYLTGQGSELPEIPILAVTGDNFDEHLALWLSCVQNRTE